jgi:pyrroline-5-carboxylate reductase
MTATTMPATLVLVGAGKMGGAMLEGWLKVGMDPRGVTVLDPNPSPEMTALCSGRGMALNPTEPRFVPEAVVLATKP